MLNPRDELYQAIQFLLRIASPYDTLTTSIVDLIGVPIDDVRSDVIIRISNLEKLLKADYGVRKVMVQSLENASDYLSFNIDLLIQMEDGKVRQETFYVNA